MVTLSTLPRKFLNTVLEYSTFRSKTTPPEPPEPPEPILPQETATLLTLPRELHDVILEYSMLYIVPKGRRTEHRVYTEGEADLMAVCR